MRIILLGAPGCGKGTHSAWITEGFGIPQISTGDILRAAVAAGTELGRSAKGFMDTGQLVPDEVILGLIRERLVEADVAAGFILDGFPRTIPQAEGLEGILADGKQPLDRVIKIDVAREELIQRITNRRVCSRCKAVYNVEFRPPKVAGTCDLCGGAVIQRDDDQEETVVRRLAVYERETAPLIEYYENKGLLAVVDGNENYDSTRAGIERILRQPER
jgi:adenylate kinase